MNVKMDVNLRTVQEQVGDNMQQVRTYSNKAAFAYIGLFGLAYDFAKDAYASRGSFIEKAEHRGEELVRELNEQLDRVQTQATDEAKKARSRVEEQVEGVSKTVTANTDALQKNAGKVLSRVGINVGDMRGDATATVIEVSSDLAELVKPFADYDELTAKDLAAKLDEMNEEMLKVVKAYESGTKNRVTVLRHIDEKLAKLQEAVA